MAQVQRELLPTQGSEIPTLGIIPTPYLPSLSCHFRCWLCFRPARSRRLDACSILLGSVLYLRRFSRRLTGRAA